MESHSEFPEHALPCLSVDLYSITIRDASLTLNNID